MKGATHKIHWKSILVYNFIEAISILYYIHYYRHNRRCREAIGLLGKLHHTHCQTPITGASEFLQQQHNFYKRHQHDVHEDDDRFPYHPYPPPINLHNPSFDWLSFLTNRNCNSFDKVRKSPYLIS